MGGRGIAVRILGFASTPSGFAFALTEGPRRLLRWGRCRVQPQSGKCQRQIERVLRCGRPLFVAFDRESALKKRERGRQFGDTLADVCDADGVMMLLIRTAQTKALGAMPKPKRKDIAEALVKMFPETAHRMPGMRKPWGSEDTRFGLFMALAAAVAAWEGFRNPKR